MEKKEDKFHRKIYLVLFPNNWKIFSAKPLENTKKKKLLIKYIPKALKITPFGKEKKAPFVWTEPNRKITTGKNWRTSWCRKSYHTKDPCISDKSFGFKKRKKRTIYLKSKLIQKITTYQGSLHKLNWMVTSRTNLCCRSAFYNERGREPTIKLRLS